MKIKKLRIKVVYAVELVDLDVSEDVFNEIVDAYENGEEIEPCRMDYPKLSDWLSDNVKEADCLDWEAEITQCRK